MLNAAQSKAKDAEDLLQQVQGMPADATPAGDTASERTRHQQAEALAAQLAQHVIAQQVFPVCSSGCCAVARILTTLRVDAQIHGDRQSCSPDLFMRLNVLFQTSVPALAVAGKWHASTGVVEVQMSLRAYLVAQKIQRKLCAGVSVCAHFDNLCPCSAACTRLCTS